MRAIGRFCVVCTLLFVTAHRLPAPIQEVQETPTPTHNQSSKAKRNIKSKDADENSENSATRKAISQSRSQPTANPHPFAGRWIGKSGDWTHVIVEVSAAQDTAVAKGVGGMWGDRGGPATVQGNTLTWTFLAEKWVMVIAPDGKTAVVTDHAWPAGTYTGTFQKVP